jgi:hypothetical protein
MSKISVEDRKRRLRQLRSLGAPKWIIKNEQAELVALRLKLTHSQLTSLVAKHVLPLMDGHAENIGPGVTIAF